MGCCQARTNAHWATQSRAGHQGPGGPNLSDVCHAKLISMADTLQATRTAVHTTQLTGDSEQALPARHVVSPV